MNADQERQEPLITVFETIDGTEAAIVKALFNSAGIPYLIRGEDEYEPFRGAFRGTIFNPLGRPVKFLVPADLAEDARRLLMPAEEPDQED